MKSLLSCLLIALVLLGRAEAQYSVAVVTDPIAQLAHSDDMAQWATSIQALNTQISQFNQQIQQLTNVQTYLGNPTAAAGSMNLSLLGGSSLSSTVNQLTSSINQTVSGAQALTNTSSGLYSATSQQTPSGFAETLDTDLFKPFAAIQQEAQNVTGVIGDTLSRITQLQQEKATALTQIQSATNQSEVQKLQAQANAIDGQIADLNHQQGTAQAQLITQDISNRNDQQMKAQATDMSLDHETAVSLGEYSQWQGQVSSDQTPFN